jgi:hypothetical protein
MFGVKAGAYPIEEILKGVRLFKFSFQPSLMFVGEVRSQP